MRNQETGISNFFFIMIAGDPFSKIHHPEPATGKDLNSHPRFAVKRVLIRRGGWFYSYFGKWHRFCPQLIHIYYPMKRLQLWLLSAFLCVAVFGQSTNDHLSHISITSPESNLTFSFFTVTGFKGQAVLRWEAPAVKTDDYFIIEKSSDAIHFEVISAMDASAGKDSVYSITDNSAGDGAVYYRVRITGKDGRELSSKTVNVNVVSDVDFKFYPNPVDRLLIVRSSHALNIQVMDANGIVKFRQDVAAGMQIVNVSVLQKGNYILKATDKATNTVISEQLVKNN
jgi:hypothetical protein